MKRSWRELPVYYVGPNGRIIRSPREDTKPIDLDSPIAKFDFATFEQALLERYSKGET